MKNFIQNGDVLSLTAAADITSGDLVKSGVFIGVAASTALTGVDLAVNLKGVYEVPCLSTDVVGQGVALYFDEAEGQVKLDDETGANALAGYSWNTKADGITTVEIRLLY